jgi:hypothetical protein
MTDRPIFSGDDAPAPGLFDDPPGADLLGQPEDSSMLFEDRSARDAAWRAWEARGRPWPPPAGLVSASMGAALGTRGRR